MRLSNSHQTTKTQYKLIFHSLKNYKLPQKTGHLFFKETAISQLYTSVLL